VAFWRTEFGRGFEGVGLECEKVMETRVVSRVGKDIGSGLGVARLSLQGCFGGFAEEATNALFRGGEFLDYTLIDWHY
jgi:hypothetical protein